MTNDNQNSRDVERTKKKTLMYSSINYCWTKRYAYLLFIQVLINLIFLTWRNHFNAIRRVVHMKNVCMKSSRDAFNAYVSLSGKLTQRCSDVIKNSEVRAHLWTNFFADFKFFSDNRLDSVTDLRGYRDLPF
jgi:hypothetical protein